ncbi:MAG: NAD-dependent epimerase/dehydratase family protein [Acidobacteria bacterium]|nr:MAG: NAD-dependent epimerase/dehydratase family protein [Acidobacteriota bacterium]
MKVLVTGATGQIGRALITELTQRGILVRAFSRKPPAAHSLPEGSEWMQGDLLDPAALERALQGVHKLFLLNAVVPDELTQALIAYNLAWRLGVAQIVYLSVFKVDQFRDVPHFASKLAVEAALREFGMPFTILRPGYFYQNDARLKDALTGAGIYPSPIGLGGMAAVDVRDIAEAAARIITGTSHAGKTYSLVADQLTGPGVAEIWSRVLGKPVQYAGHDFDVWEKQLAAFVPAWSAFDLRVMFQGYAERGFTATPTETAAFASLLGRAPRRYEAFAQETAVEWKA